MNRPLVSVGIPVFNGERYLEAAIQSLVDQSFTDFELIISDNGSTDRTAEIGQAWADRDPRVRYLRSPVNRGAAWNFRRAFEESRGAYFKWAADDDTLLPDWLTRCVKVLDTHPDVVIAYTSVVEMDENSEFIEYWEKYSDVTADQAIDRLRPVLTDYRCLPVWGLIRKQALERTGLLRPHDSSDRVLLGELAILGKFHRVEEHLFYHREHPYRSMQAYESQHDRGVFFDPKNVNPITYWPNWRYYISFCGVILRHSLSPGEKLRGLGAIGREMTSARRLLLSDAVVAGRTAFRSLTSRR